MYSRQRLDDGIFHVQEAVSRYSLLLSSCEPLHEDRARYLRSMLETYRYTLTCLVKSRAVLERVQRRLDGDGCTPVGAPESSAS